MFLAFNIFFRISPSSVRYSVLDTHAVVEPIGQIWGPPSQGRDQQKDEFPPFNQPKCDWLWFLDNSLWLKWQCWLSENGIFRERGDLLHLTSDTVRSMRRRPGGWRCHWTSAAELEPPHLPSGCWWRSRRWVVCKHRAGLPTWPIAGTECELGGELPAGLVGSLASKMTHL